MDATLRKHPAAVPGNPAYNASIANIATAVDASFKLDIAAALGVDSSRIVILSKSVGSVRMNFIGIPDNADLGDNSSGKNVSTTNPSYVTIDHAAPQLIGVSISWLNRFLFSC